MGMGFFETFQSKLCDQTQNNEFVNGGPFGRRGGSGGGRQGMVALTAITYLQMQIQIVVRSADDSRRTGGEGKATEKGFPDS